jgi:tRNA-dihydrouridine synthase A
MVAHTALSAWRFMPPLSTIRAMHPSRLNRRLSVAPMLDWTDRYCRYFLRLLSHHTLLYTEMVTTGALLHGDADRFLRFDPAEHPLALQLGGSDPHELAACARLGADYGYDEINLNVGCPSDRVQSGRFGACLMAEPDLVADCIAAMGEAVDIAVTVKHRIGIDEQDSYDALSRFVATVAQAGCQVFIVHARKAWLQGLSPKQNREIPPLKYEVVHQLKRDFPAVEFVINGGFKTLAQVETELQELDGVMIGREAYANPWLLAEADRRIFGVASNPYPDPHSVIQALLPFAEREVAAGTPLARIARHILGLFQGRPGARAWRRHLSEHAHLPSAGAEVIEQALAKVPR